MTEEDQESPNIGRQDGADALRCRKRPAGGHFRNRLFSPSEQFVELGRRLISRPDYEQVCRIYCGMAKKNGRPPSFSKVARELARIEARRREHCADASENNPDAVRVGRMLYKAHQVGAVWQKKYLPALWRLLRRLNPEAARGCLSHEREITIIWINAMYRVERRVLKLLVDIFIGLTSAHLELLAPEIRQALGPVFEARRDRQATWMFVLLVEALRRANGGALPRRPRRAALEGLASPAEYVAHLVTMTIPGKYGRPCTPRKLCAMFQRRAEHLDAGEVRILLDRLIGLLPS